MKRILFILIIIGVAYLAKAQQTISPDHYLIQQYMINPAAAGMNGSNIFIDYRKQWAGFTGAPETQILCLDGPVNRENIGLGLTIVNDQVNILGTTNALTTFAYRIKYGEDHYLRIGVSGGINNNKILFDKIIAKDPSEVLLLNNDQNSTSFDAAGGLLYQYKDLLVGLAVTNLFEEKYYYENNFMSKNLNFQSIRHYMFNAQYLFEIEKDKWGVMPSVQILTAQGLRSFVGGGITGFYKNDLWLTVAYKNKVSFSASIGGIVSKNVILAYSYSYSTNLVGYNQGTHDIILGYRFGSKKTGSSGDLKAIDELRNKTFELYETTDMLKNENEKLRVELDSSKKDIQKLKDELEKLKSSSSLSSTEEKQIEEFRAKHEVKSFNTSNFYDSDSTFRNEQYCVIAGAYKTVENAKLGQEILKREINLDTYLIKKPSSSFYFIATDFFDNMKDVTDEHKRLKALNIDKLINGATWVYKAE